MGLEKAYCRFCSNEDKGRYSIFEAVAEAEICYCPYCTRGLKPKDAIKDFNILMNNFIKKANKVLYEKTDFAEAYRMFGRIIDLVPESEEARFGRLIALLYLSTLRKAYFKEFYELFNRDKEYYFSRSRNKDSFVIFLEKINFAIDEYDRLFRRRLMYHRYFYNADCIKLFLVRINEIKQLKQMILLELEPYMQKEKHSTRASSLYSELQLEISTKENEAKHKFITGDGSTYKLIEFSDKGNPLLAKEEHKAKVSGIRLFNKTLEDDGTSKYLIKDRVFPDNTHLYRWVKVDFIFIIIFFFAIFASLIATALLRKQTDLYWIGYIVFGLSVTVFIVLLILRIVWRYKIKSRRHLID